MTAKFGAADYWQKDACAKWDGYCTAGQTNCDECAEFRRHRPQYCVRCGATFYERRENNVCGPCRAARKKQYRRKFAILESKGKLVRASGQRR
jgi:predicted amidophosphoribosyltransferase